MRKESAKKIFFLLFTATLLFSGTIAADNPVVSHPGWTRDAVIYEVNIRQYTAAGTFAEFQKHLPRLKELGIDILWLMPIHPIGEKNRKGSLGSYYSIRDFKEINPEFGDLKDFKALVTTAHELGMHVILDWVANHSSWDNSLITEHPEWYKKDSTGKIVPPVADWYDVAQLDYSVPEMREYMKNAMLYWIREADVDGFRCDVAEMVPIDFWKSTITELRKAKDIFMLAESESPEMHRNGFDMTYSWELFHLMKSIAKRDKAVQNIDSIIIKERKAFPEDAYRMKFTTNHDENYWGGTERELFGDGAQTFSTLSFLLPGMPMIYSGQETGLDKRLRFYDKDTIDRPSDLQTFRPSKGEVFYQNLIALKTDQVALHNGIAGGSYNLIRNDSEGKVFSFIRKRDTSEVVAIMNLSPEPVTVNISTEEISGKWKTYPGQINFPISGFQKIDLKSWEYFILTR